MVNATFRQNALKLYYKYSISIDRSFVKPVRTFTRILLLLFTLESITIGYYRIFNLKYVRFGEVQNPMPGTCVATLLELVINV